MYLPGKNNSTLRVYVSDSNKDGGLDKIIRGMKTVSISGQKLGGGMNVMDYKAIQSSAGDSKSIKSPMNDNAND